MTDLTSNQQSIVPYFREIAEANGSAAPQALLAAVHEIERLQLERAAAIDRLAPLGLENERLRAALGPDAAGREFAELLETAADVLLSAGGGPLEDCLRQKAVEVREALSGDSPPVVETSREPVTCTEKDAARYEFLRENWYALVSHTSCSPTGRHVDLIEVSDNLLGQPVDPQSLDQAIDAAIALESEKSAQETTPRPLTQPERDALSRAADASVTVADPGYESSGNGTKEP